MTRLSIEAKQAILKQALSSDHKSQAQIAAANNIGYSTLQKWLRASREGRPLVASSKSNNKGCNSHLIHLLATANLNERAVGDYCREHGIYSHQLTSWKENLISQNNNEKHIFTKNRKVCLASKHATYHPVLLLKPE